MQIQCNKTATDARLIRYSELRSLDTCLNTIKIESILVVKWM